MRIKAAIFDMDGTLIDSMHMWAHLGSIYLKKKGFEAQEDMDDVYWTMTMDEGINYMKRQYGLQEENARVKEEMYQIMKDFYACEVEEKPGIRLVLEELSRAGIPMCVASATDTPLVEIALERVGIRSYFQRIFCCREVGEGKHSDKIYQAAREYMGTPLEETLVFEDAPYAAETVKRAGFPLVSIKDDSVKDQERMKELGDLYVEDYREWPGVL
ncbi:MAG: HAD family phosphatase [Clostridiales bacterium]|nr:HAD family phosphatase [Clostridiales bacterium]